MAGKGIFTSNIERAQNRLKTLFGEETFLSFREDVCDIYTRHNNVHDASEWKKRAWVRMGREGLEETKLRYLTFGTHLDLLNISDFLFSALIGWVVNRLLVALGIPALPAIFFGFLLTLLLYALNTGLIFAKALVSEIAYPPEEIHTRLNPTELRFRAGWNKGVIQSSASMIGIILYGMLTSPDSRGYKLGLSIVELWAEHR